jgi:DNA-binding transcriptional MocR family regulator
MPVAMGDHHRAGFERNTILRSLVEASQSKVEFMGLHLPAADPFVAEALEHVAEDVGPHLDHHGYWPVGLPSLRAAIAAHLTKSGLPSHPEEILVTHGAQEAIGLAASLFLSPGRVVVLEDPTYVGAIDVFAAAGARLSPVPVTEHGVRMDILRDAVARDAPGLIYLMPTFQNPTGVVTPESHRREIAAIAAERGIPVFEDDALANLDMGHRPPRPIASFAPSAPILSVGSFSKLMWGGLRAGWIRAPEALIGRLARRKALGDLGNSAVSQAVAARLLPRAGEIREFRRKQISERLAVMEREISRRLPEWTWRRPGGGLSLWVRLPRGNAVEFARAALRHGVSILPGTICSPSNGCSEYLRLPFVLEPPKIREGVRLLAEAWSAYAPAPRKERAELEVLV